MIRPKDLSDCDCSPWQKLKQQIQALYEAVTQLGYKNTEQDGEIAGLDGRVSALEDAPPGSTAWGDITGDLDDQTDLKNALDGKMDDVALATVATSGDYGDLDNKPDMDNYGVGVLTSNESETDYNYVELSLYNQEIMPLGQFQETARYYKGTGQNEDGSMTQKAMTTALANKPDMQVENQAPTSSDAGSEGDFWLDTTTGNLYQCTAADPSIPSYTWAQVNGGGGGSLPFHIYAMGTQNVFLYQNSALENNSAQVEWNSIPTGLDVTKVNDNSFTIIAPNVAYETNVNNAIQNARTYYSSGSGKLVTQINYNPNLMLGNVTYLHTNIILIVFDDFTLSSNAAKGGCVTRGRSAIPTTVPKWPNLIKGAYYFDDTNKKLMIYDGSDWYEAALTLVAP